MFIIIMMFILSGCGQQDRQKESCTAHGDGCTQTVEVTGPPGPRGESGPTGAAGTNGKDGASGPAGVSGSTGAAGQAGTIILPIKFCPNSVAVYPSVFPEYGVCIDNKLYAVYSANDGFLTEIPPGQYSSNAIGSSCTFTVLLNCQIQ